MLNGIGAGAGATDSVLCTAPFRLVGLGFGVVSPGCIVAGCISVIDRRNSAAVQPTQKAFRESKSLARNRSGGNTLSSALEWPKTASVFLLIVAFACSLRAQTYKVRSGSSVAPQVNAPQTPPPDKSLGWGSNIQNARLAGAAELALREGNYPAAVDYAQRAANATPNQASLWFLLGYAARLDGKSQLSVAAYSRGLRLNPSALDGISGLAQTYSTMGRPAEAERLLNQVLAVDPKRINDAVLLGEILLRSEDYASAIDVLGRAEQIQPGARSELLMALAYEHQKQLDPASRYLELAKRHAPDNPDVQRSLAGYYRETGNYPAAIAALNSLHSSKPDVRAELAYTYQLNGQQDEAAKLYVHAANAEPRDLGLQLSAAQAEVAVGSVEDATPFLLRASALDPENYRLHALRGEIARLQEHPDDAVREFNAALAHLPPSPAEGPLYGIQLQMNLAELYQSLGDASAAHDHLQIAQGQISGLDDRGSSRPRFLRLRAVIKINTSDLDGAGSDINEALAINAQDPNSLQLDGDLLQKLGRTAEAIPVYIKILSIDPVNRAALISLGYASRDAGHDQDAEEYFQRLATAYPTLYVPYLALGDMYASRRDFPKAAAAYIKGYELAPSNSLIVAGGMNSAIETHQLPMAGVWLSRATREMQQEPHLMREKERYLSFKGEYQQSADIGREVIKKLSMDRDVVVYLAYDLLYLQQYDALLQLTSQYDSVLPKEPDIPLLAGYAHKRAGELDQAQKDFSQALGRDSEIVTAYVNRGYVLHDLHQAAAAALDFESALKREPNNGEALLGLAYASLDLHRPIVALRQVQLAQEQMGDSMPIHLIRATAYGQNGMLLKAAGEYRAALKYSPNDAALHLALGDTLCGRRQYHEAIEELQVAQKLSPDNRVIYAELARAYAQLHDQEQTFLYVRLAEQPAPQTQLTATADEKEQSRILVSTGQALSLLADQKGAMERFERALAMPDSDRISVRLAIAQVMAHEGELNDAQRQVALALMEGQTEETLPATGEQLMEAADVFLSMHDYLLAQTYLQRALAAGAPEASVRIGMANAYLALGDTARAQDQISQIGGSGDSEPGYQYLLAKANVLRQEHQDTQALTAFAQAANVDGEHQAAEQDLVQAGATEGLRINPKFSVLSDFSVTPIFEDTTVYVLDSKLDVTNPVPGREELLPPPRSSLETEWTGAYHLHLGDLPEASGFFQVRNARGEISLPSEELIVNRDTTDYSFNFGLNPTLHLGTNVLTFNTGIQETVRRDSVSPVAMNQNLFRQFLYLSTSSFFNIISVSGYAIREAGPFTESAQHSRELASALNFRVGRPWGKTALVSGWGARDDRFSPVISEDYYASAYIGLERKFSQRLQITAIAEDLRAWRIFGGQAAIAQALRPAGSAQFAATRNWSVQASVAYSRNMGSHVYDAVQSGFAISYAMPIHRAYRDEGREVELQYPIRFSAGMQQETFFNFTGGQNQEFRPYLRITLF
jgi:tetratricopeptide (TPR) repeat protein